MCLGAIFCQDVCPWNRGAEAGEGAVSLEELAGLTEAEFRGRFRGTAVSRAKYGGFFAGMWRLLWGIRGGWSFWRLWSGWLARRILWWLSMRGGVWRSWEHKALTKNSISASFIVLCYRISRACGGWRCCPSCWERRPWRTRNLRPVRHAVSSRLRRSSAGGAGRRGAARVRTSWRRATFHCNECTSEVPDYDRIHAPRRAGLGRPCLGKLDERRVRYCGQGRPSHYS